MNTYQPAEATVKNAKTSLVVRNLDETFNISIVIGAHDSVGVRVNLVYAAWGHL